MSPEQARGKPVDQRADVWAFGCVLYQMLAARSPFAGETISNTIAKTLNESLTGTRFPLPHRRGSGSCCADVSRRISTIGCTT